MPPKQFHSLTEQLSYPDLGSNNIEAMKFNNDSIVRKWLSEKAEELDKSRLVVYKKEGISMPIPNIKEILGLEPKGEEKECPCASAKPGQVVEVVFETDNYADSKHSIIVKCAKCFTPLPRPSKPTKREELAEKLREAWNRTHTVRFPDSTYYTLADIALSFLGDKGE